MKARTLSARERAALLARPDPLRNGPGRVLDAAERHELANLYRTRQATREQLAERFGVSTRTVSRYAAALPITEELWRAARRLRAEAVRRGLELTTDDIVALTVACLDAPYGSAA